MIRIQLAAQFIESALRTGAVHEKTEIVDGIPRDHILVEARLTNSSYGPVVELTFVPRDEQRKSIIVKVVRQQEESVT